MGVNRKELSVKEIELINNFNKIAYYCYRNNIIDEYQKIIIDVASSEEYQIYNNDLYKKRTWQNTGKIISKIAKAQNILNVLLSNNVINKEIIIKSMTN